MERYSGMRSIVAVVALAFAAAQPAVAAQPVPYLPIPKDGAVILDTGSTNTIGYRIVISATGAAEYVQGSNRATARVPSAVAAAFFADLKKGMPLSRLHVAPCMKSASFGTSTYLWWRGQRSPDLSCPGDATVTALSGDIAAVSGALHLSAAMGGHMVQMPQHEPRKPMTEPTPSASPRSSGLAARVL
jgi:hypothetical protein